MKIKNEKTLDDFIYREQLELKYYSEEHITPHQKLIFGIFPIRKQALYLRITEGSEHQTTLYRTSFRQFDERVKQLKPRLKGHLNPRRSSN